MIPKQVESLVEQKLNDFTEISCEINAIKSIGGGCINQTAKIEASVGDYFLKWNSPFLYPGMFEAEVKGLKLLDKQKALIIPAVISSGNTGNDSFLLLEYIEKGPNTTAFWKHFGKSLAELHRVCAPFFGLDHDNYIGSLPQSNRNHKDWSSFFIAERIEPQIKLARENGSIANATIARFESLYKKLEDIFPPEPSALIHGDLWNGNFMATQNEQACIFDPAVYFGHREMDIAMSKLFGGFDQKFYDSYNFHFPLQKGWENRIDICNLYPLMVHVNLFGGGYLQQVESILKRFK